MNNNANPMKIRFPASSAVLEPDKDELLSATDSGDLRVETRRAPCGVEYVVERDAKEESSRAAAALAAALPMEARKRGGSSRSERKLAAIARNLEKSDGRTPTTPDGIARLPLRKALEGIFGKPLPKDGPVAKLVHKMSSAAVVRRTWPLVEPTVPDERRAEVAALVENLARTIDENPRPKRETENVDEFVPLPDDGKPKTNLSPDEWFRRRHANDDPETIARLAEDMHASAARSSASWQRPHHPQPPPQ